MLRKKYSRKRKVLKEVSPSGTGRSAVIPAKKDVHDYSFMEWLAPHEANRKSSTNIVDEVDEGDSSDSGDDTDDPGDQDTIPNDENIIEDRPRKPSEKNAKKRVMKGMETIVKRRLEPSQKDTKEDGMDTIFGKMIANEVRLFSKDVKFEVKHNL